MFSLANGKLVKKENTTIRMIPDSGLPSFKDEPKNKLESVAILTTSREINEGLLSRLLTNISKTTQPTDIELNIFTNNSKHTPVSLENVKSIFRSVNIVNIDIRPEDDVYYKHDWDIHTKLPPYGRVSGPNILFLKSMEVCKKYNTTLVLETDCKLFPGWLEKGMNYASMEYFLISGSTYDGDFIATNQDMTDYTLRFHINGVAFYKTGSPVFQCMMSLLDPYIQYSVAQLDSSRGYDYHIFYMVMLFTLISPTPESQKFWKNVVRYIFKTSLIVNFAGDRDSHLDETEILSVHKQCVILHKKYSDSTHVPRKFLWSK
jgi:hypothetical protein